MCTVHAQNGTIFDVVQMPLHGKYSEGYILSKKVHVKHMLKLTVCKSHSISVYCRHMDLMANCHVQIN